MKLGWGKERIKPFVKKITVAKRTNWVWNLVKLFENILKKPFTKGKNYDILK